MNKFSHDICTLLTLGVFVVMFCFFCGGCTRRMTEDDLIKRPINVWSIESVKVIKRNLQTGTSDRSVLIIPYPGIKWVITFCDKTDEWYERHNVYSGGELKYP